MNWSTLCKDIRSMIWSLEPQIMEIYESMDPSVQYKKDSSPLTEADTWVHDQVTTYLELKTPDIPIVSEESSRHERMESSLFWVLDPIDGTKEFLAKNGEFTVNLALVQEDRPIMGIVFAPALQQLYWALSQEGAFRQGPDGSQESIQTSGLSIERKGLRVVCSRSHLDTETTSFIDSLENPVTVQKGGSMKFMDVASGAADIYPRFGPTMEWDTCAPQIVVEEAGGRLIDQSTNLPMRYNKPNYRNHSFIVFAN